MINVNVVAIDQRYALGAGGQLQNYLVLRLPNGAEARAAIDTETAKMFLVLDAKNNQGAISQEPSAPITSAGWEIPHTPTPQTQQAPQPVPEETGPTLFDWMALPDDTLPAYMKAAFTKLELPGRMTPDQINNMVREVSEKFGPEEWQEALGDGWKELLPRAAPAPAPAPRPQPALGVVAWADGSPMVAGTSTRGRTVPKTDMGYPILNDGSVDPGEVVAGGEQDEDGVGSL